MRLSNFSKILSYCLLIVNFSLRAEVEKGAKSICGLIRILCPCCCDHIVPDHEQSKCGCIYILHMQMIEFRIPLVRDLRLSMRTKSFDRITPSHPDTTGGTSLEELLADKPVLDLSRNIMINYVDCLSLLLRLGLRDQGEPRSICCADSVRSESLGSQVYLLLLSVHQLGSTVHVSIRIFELVDVLAAVLISQLLQELMHIPTI